MFRVFGWTWTIAGIVVALLTFGSAFVIYVPMMSFGMLCIMFANSQALRRAIRKSQG